MSALFPSALNVDTVLGGGTTTAQGLFIEMFLTAQFVFVILMLAVEKHRSTYLAPIPIGATFFLAELVGMSRSPYIFHPSFPTMLRTRSQDGVFADDDHQASISPVAPLIPSDPSVLPLSTARFRAITGSIGWGPF